MPYLAEKHAKESTRQSRRSCCRRPEDERLAKRQQEAQDIIAKEWDPQIAGLKAAKTVKSAGRSGWMEALSFACGEEVGFPELQKNLELSVPDSRSHSDAHAHSHERKEPLQGEVSQPQTADPQTTRGEEALSLRIAGTGKGSPQARQEGCRAGLSGTADPKAHAVVFS